MNDAVSNLLPECGTYGGGFGGLVVGFFVGVGEGVGWGFADDGLAVLLGDGELAFWLDEDGGMIDLVGEIDADAVCELLDGAAAER